MSNMKPFKPVYMKTYGKQSRKVSAWISPENRKQAFDSTTSTDGDISMFEPARPRGRRRSVASHRAVRPAKRKALTKWTIDEENIPSPSSPQPALQSKTKREKKTGGSSGRASRPAKRKAALHMIDISSDEENVSRPSPPCPQRSKTTRKSRVVSVSGALMRQRREQVPRTSESEIEMKSTAECHKSSVQMKTDSNVNLPSAGRFVTHRRRAVPAKPKLPKATFSILNSSDDFASRAFGSSKILQPSRRRRVPPQFLVSSAENSLNAAGAASFATIPFREISLNESADRIALCPKKPIFCSTPSAGPFNKRPRLKPLSINDQSATPPSMSVSSICVLSTFQEDLNSPGQPFSPPTSAPPVGLHSEEKSQSSLAEQEPSGDLFMEAKSSSEEAKNHSEDIQTKNVGELPSLNLLSTEDSNSSSHFVSAAGGLEWLIEALKEKCLTEHCTVQLERLCSLTVTQLCSQTTYSSCLGDSSSIHSRQANEHPPSFDLSQSLEPSFSLNLFVTNNKTSGCFESVSSSESPGHVALVTESQRLTNNSPSVDCTNSAELSSSKEPTEQSASVLHVESTHSTDGSIEFVMGTQLPANSFLPALIADEEAAALKDGSLTKKCKLQLKQLKWPVQQKEADANRSENNCTQDIENSEDLTLSGEIAERISASLRQPVNNSGPVAQTRSNESETAEKAALLTTMLKEKCLTNRVIVAIKRVTLSQLKDILQLRDRKHKASTDVSASDDQTKKPHQSDSDTNHGNKDTSFIDFNMRKRGSASSEEKTASDKENVVKNTCNVPNKRKKTSLAPKDKKRRSTSTDRPGTTRKACVSGLSVSRWKNKDGASTHAFRGRNKAVDCSINELMSAKHKQPRELLGSTMNFSTPVRVNRLNLSSLLADFTPNTHTWSRLKAALSVHRKGLVLRTPGGSSPWVMGSPGRAALADVSQDLFASTLRTPLPKHLRSQLMSSNSHVECEDADLSDAEKVYAECGQQRPLPWEECILPQRMKQCVKIGEGTFGEVFSTINASGDTVALKIIPVEGSEKVNGEDQKTFGEILHEIIISKELSSLKEKQQNQTHGFIGLNDLHCVQGGYPPDFLNAWDAFDQKKGSENDRPDFFQKDQLFIILEFEFGGVDLENSNGTLTSLGVAKSILHQVTAALAVAEHELHFEHSDTVQKQVMGVQLRQTPFTKTLYHQNAFEAIISRDLHWGNVLVKTTKQKKGSFLLNGAAHSLETKGVLVRIIDYSLSRLEIDDLTVSCDISKDEELFMGQGDYQFDIYRLMRQENGNNWTEYHPHTNVLWLHYLCSKLLSMKYRGSGGRGAKDTREELTRFYGNVLQYSSATEALQNCPMFQ